MRNYEHSGLFSSTLDFPFFSVTFLFTDLYTIIKGNIKFSARDNRGALKLYTESVICAPDIGPELGLAFANRSAALFHLGQYKAACDDISMALQHKYPKHLGWLKPFLKLTVITAQEFTLLLCSSTAYIRGHSLNM